MEKMTSSGRRAHPDGVEFPAVRVQVAAVLKSLADSRHQQHVWADRAQGPGDAVDDLTMVVNVLDDARVLENPEQTVGEVLRDEHEAAALRELAELLDVLIDMLGDAPDADYMASPRWPAIVRAARTARERMRHTDDQRSGVRSRSAQKEHCVIRQSPTGGSTSGSRNCPKWTGP
ncbi:hypothetical protein ACIQ9E_06720 [Streptomyces sp. NPDC094448]|uniref:SCO4402 family protein n=1 Tax=Streptomyces sp. NPDC094448 TaxID=3366063 RepID=UPI003817DB98